MIHHFTLRPDLPPATVYTFPQTPELPRPFTSITFKLARVQTLPGYVYSFFYDDILTH